MSAVDTELAAIASSIRELDSRTNDGVTVRMLWDAHTGEITIDVHNDRDGGAFHFKVAGGLARDAFMHPYAYASRPDVTAVAA